MMGWEKPLKSNIKIEAFENHLNKKHTGETKALLHSMKQDAPVTASSDCQVFCAKIVRKRPNASGYFISC